MKHFVVINQWATEMDSGLNIIGVAHTFAEAKEMFDNALADERKFAAEMNWHIEIDDEDSFEAYEEGYYASAHTVLYIQGVN